MVSANSLMKWSSMMRAFSGKGGEDKVSEVSSRKRGHVEDDERE